MSTKHAPWILFGAVLCSPLTGCRSERVLTPEIGAPLCAPDLDPEVKVGVVEDEVFVPLEGEVPQLPVDNSWQVVTAGFALSVKGIEPEGVQVLFSWHVRDSLAGEQTFSTDLLCDEGGTPRPMPLTLSIGSQYGAIADFATPVDGRLSVAVTAAGGDPAACLEAAGPEDCLVVDQALQYLWAGEGG